MPLLRFSTAQPRFPRSIEINMSKVYKTWPYLSESQDKVSVLYKQTRFYTQYRGTLSVFRIQRINLFVKYGRTAHVEKRKSDMFCLWMQCVAIDVQVQYCRSSTTSFHIEKYAPVLVFGNVIHRHLANCKILVGSTWSQKYLCVASVESDGLATRTIAFSTTRFHLIVDEFRVARARKFFLSVICSYGT